MEIELNKLLNVIKMQEWTTAKSYNNTAPHQYIIDKQNRPLYRAMRHLIDTYGFEREFRLFKTVQMYRYFYLGEYSYWYIDEVLNRCRLDGSFIRL